LKAFVLLPAFNEAPALQQLIPAIAETLSAALPLWQIVVVDDGSTDQTRSVVDGLASSLPVLLLRHQANHGYGAALSTGFEWIVQHADPDDAAVSMDADRTHPPETLPALVRALTDGADVVTASYAIPGGRSTGVPGARTYTNGYRAYRVKILKDVQTRYGRPLIGAPGFPGGTELFLKACAAGARAREVPFILRYENRGSGSKIRLFRTIGGYLALLAASRKRLLSPGPT
jgi:dolichol-phosphate mannosyltransferase